MPHDARSIANRLIRLGQEANAPRDPLQVIKLTYLCHGWMLGLYQRELSSQPVEAWQYGPVIPDVYHSLKRHGRKKLTQTIESFDACFDYKEEDLVRQVFDGYEKFSGIELSQLTHAKGTPWHITRNRYGRDSIIPNDLIERHYAARVGS